MEEFVSLGVGSWKAKRWKEEYGFWAFGFSQILSWWVWFLCEFYHEALGLVLRVRVGEGESLGILCIVLI